jgi:hypothetical protein
MIFQMPPSRSGFYKSYIDLRGPVALIYVDWGIKMPATFRMRTKLDAESLLVDGSPKFILHT